MRGELIAPNWHVILIHYPLGLLGLGLLIELLSFSGGAGQTRCGMRVAGCCCSRRRLHPDRKNHGFVRLSRCDRTGASGYE